MKSAPIVTQQLNQVLRLYLTGINQYFLHSRIAGDWGLDRLKAGNYKASIHQMKAADKLIERILFLEALPNLQDLGRLRIGENTPELLSSNLDFEMELRSLLVSAIKEFESEQDYISRDLLKELLEESEEQIDHIEASLGLIESIGLQNFNQKHMGDDS